MGHIARLQVPNGHVGPAAGVFDSPPEQSGQPGELRRRLDAGQRLADEYRMAEPQAVQLCSEAMLAHVEGRFDDARRHYLCLLVDTKKHPPSVVRDPSEEPNRPQQVGGEGL